MRLGVLDVGSTTVHLLVVDAHRGGKPEPLNSKRSVLRLVEHIDSAGRLSDDGQEALLYAIGEAALAAARAGCEQLLAFATSAVREATNWAEIVADVAAQTRVDLRVMSGEDEARLTFLAARRWYGFSRGALLVLDIGGGSLEFAGGTGEEPDLAMSVPLGAARVAREAGMADPPKRSEAAALAKRLAKEMAPLKEKIAHAGPIDHVVGTSKTFRTLARLGAASSLGDPRVLTAASLDQVISRVSKMSIADVAGLDGVSPERAPHLLAGALVARAALSATGAQVLEICPWALREGVIFRQLDELEFGR
ncbi:hypothetical protein EH165_13365 [Nakamurella antarctica]|uniref:Ppx/GppA phosphatase N-terminal domain-containing protein n=1 Tax=Nakamurella antarctica TaxID=1902245 RepID=A0A3G8ZPC2_9ACTN|nr:hypothetical protein [Nakamurella antarctica]AZI58988.1 hypothetical protein EH165_13365 [Nakamurella antarctica]